MAATTLNTFILRLPHSVRTVDLIGSWDNFQQAYPLQRDRRAGPGHWRGCHSFKNITCDGHSLDPSISRDGGLRMGGTYWYFYRLDGEVEQHDRAEPSITDCPLLPGQRVNVLEVPTQHQPVSGSDHCPRTFSDPPVFTLDPQAKYDSPRPSLHHDILQKPDFNVSISPTQAPLTDSYQPSRHSTASAVDLQPLERAHRNTRQGPCVFLSKASSLMAIFHKLRGTRSAPSERKKLANRRRSPAGPSWPAIGNVGYHKTSVQDKAFIDLLSNQPRAPVNTPNWPSAAAQTRPFTPWSANMSEELPAEGETSPDLKSRYMGEPTVQAAAQSRFSEDSFDDSTHNNVSGNHGPETNPDQSWYLLQPVTAASTSTALSAESLEHHGNHVEEDIVDHKTSPLTLPTPSNVAPSRIGLEEDSSASYCTGLKRSARPPPLSYDEREPLATFHTARPSPDGQLSPRYSSQPESPSLRDFDEASDSESQPESESQGYTFDKSPAAGYMVDNEGSNMVRTPQLPNSGFQGYVLQETEHASTLTLRKPGSVIFSTTEELSENDCMIQSWNDGSTHGPVTALDELVDDLGYLGQFIVRE
ncbi:MAG: hypothetical protein Q9219_004444 [cf. Caloplaca sp. 3 TL-2023]